MRKQSLASQTDDIDARPQSHRRVGFVDLPADFTDLVDCLRREQQLVVAMPLQCAFDVPIKRSPEDPRDDEWRQQNDRHNYNTGFIPEIWHTAARRKRRSLYRRDRNPGQRGQRERKMGQTRRRCVTRIDNPSEAALRRIEAQPLMNLRI